MNGHNLDTTNIIQSFVINHSTKFLGKSDEKSKRRASTDAAGWKEEPVHEDAFAIVVRIVSQESMPFVFLLAAAVAVATAGSRFSVSLHNENL